MMAAGMNNVVLIVGKPGCGKSYLASRLVRAYTRGRYKARVVVVDMPAGTSPYRPYVRDRAVVDRRHVCLAWDELIADHPSILIEVSDLTAQEIQVMMDGLCAAILRAGDTLLVIDEAHQFFPRTRTPLGLERLLRAGRKWGIDVIMVTQIVVDLAIAAIKLANVLVAFQVTERNDLSRLAPYFDGDSEALFKLKWTQYIAKDMRTGTIEHGTTRRLPFRG